MPDKGAERLPSKKVEIHSGMPLEELQSPKQSCC